MKSIRPLFVSYRRFIGALAFVFTMTGALVTAQPAALEQNLSAAIRNNDSKQVYVILKKGGEELKQSVISSHGHYLEMAARFGSYDLLQMLIKVSKQPPAKSALGKALVAAMENHKIDQLSRVLVGMGADVNYDSDNRGPLSALVMLNAGATANKNRVLTALRFLLSKGAYVDSFNESGETPLMNACRQNDTAMVKLLLEFKANPSLTNKDGISAYALAKKGSEIENMLLAKGKRIIPVNTGLFAPGNPQPQGISLLDESFVEQNQLPHDKGLFADPASNNSPQHQPESLKIDDAFANRPTGKHSLFATPEVFNDRNMLLAQLSAAAAAGDTQQVQELVNHGIDVNATFDATLIPALMQAADAKTAQILIDAGADPRIRDAQGYNVLHHLATRQADSNLLDLLLKTKADINARNNDGQTPLRLAGIMFVENISPAWGEEFIARMVQAGADINSADHNGQTLLHQAANNDNAALARVCIRLGANLDRKDSAADSPLHIARRLGARKFMAELAKKKD